MVEVFRCDPRDEIWQACNEGRKSLVSYLYYSLLAEKRYSYRSWARSYMESIVTDEGDKYLASEHH